MGKFQKFLTTRHMKIPTDERDWICFRKEPSFCFVYTVRGQLDSCLKELKLHHYVHDLFLWIDFIKMKYENLPLDRCNRSLGEKNVPTFQNVCSQIVFLSRNCWAFLTENVTDFSSDYTHNFGQKLQTHIFVKDIICLSDFGSYRMSLNENVGKNGGWHWLNWLSSFVLKVITQRIMCRFISFCFTYRGCVFKLRLSIQFQRSLLWEIGYLCI